jgi:mitotic spindle assembly checkpoint protein MAD2
MFSAFGINSILYQRGLYPSETFTRVQKYGLTLLVTTDPELIKYLNNVDQLKGILLLDTVLSFAGLNVNRILGLPR